MLTIKLLLLIIFLLSVFVKERASEEPVLYYYGIEESERSLPRCEAQQACSAAVQRYWRPTALVRLCRCGPRQHCDTPATSDRLIEINNRAHLQFCQPIANWSECAYSDQALTVTTSYDRMNPDDLELLHHTDVQLVPPKITVKCKCRYPNYWKLNSTLENNVKIYQCASLPLCSTEEFCGNVNYDLNALYQSCLCPRHHMCIHSGGVTHIQISEILYSGKGWKAYCKRTDGEYSYEEY